MKFYELYKLIYSIYKMFRTVNEYKMLSTVNNTGTQIMYYISCTTNTYTYTYIHLYKST